MIYKSFPPSPLLSEFVRNYTIIHLQFNIHEPPPVKQRSPKPEQKIVFYIKGKVNLPDPKVGGMRTPPPVAIYSHQLDKRSLQISSEFLALIIFLRPGTLHRMIRLPMSEFQPEFSDAELFFGTDVRLVTEQLAEAPTHSVMIDIAERFLFSKCKTLDKKSSLDTVASSMLADPTSFSLDAMADQACLSSKQFYRKFIDRIGITPKLFSRLSRFNHAYQFKLNHPDVAWSTIAQEYAYTDYHHLEKEFKSFLGLTPKEWIEAELSAPERILKLR
jgi:AraC-like DNA-binding protein